MRKTDITEVLAAKIGRKDAQIAMDTVIETISEGIVNEGRVQINGLGVFRARQVPRRRARNPRTGEMVWAKKTGAVSFRPSDTLKSHVSLGRIPKKRAAKKAAAAPATKKAATAKTSASTPPAKKAATTKAAAKKTTAKKTVAKKAATKKTTAKKTTAKKAAAKKK